MLYLRLTDNNYKGVSLQDAGVDFSILPDLEKLAVRKALDSINNVPLCELEKNGIVVFPSKTTKSDLDGKDKIILTVQNLETDTPIVKTTNTMGFFCVGNVLQIEIRSRFESGEKQFFLHYMLQKVCNVAPTVELAHANKSPFYEFAVYLFPSYLKRALGQGLFRNYVNREYNDSNIRGSIDFVRHFKNNIPFNGKIAYKTREFSYDNPLVQLIRHTVEYISENRTFRAFLENSVHDEMQKVRACTASYRRSERNKVISKNIKSISSPYYYEYEALRKLCLMILLREKNSYGALNNKRLNGILFDGASLWEEYLNVVMQTYFKNKLYVLEHPNNRTGHGRRYLFKNEDEKNRTAIYPDFILFDNNKRVVSILDAKYKDLSDGNASREDYFQILAYLLRFNCNRGVLIYPYSKRDVVETKSVLFLAKESNDERRGDVAFEIQGLTIPGYSTNDSDKVAFEKFSNEMNKNEQALFSSLQGGFPQC